MTTQAARAQQNRKPARINLINAMARRHISASMLADLLGCGRTVVLNKLYGVSDFTLTEAIKIFDAHFRDCDFRILFAAEAE